MARESQDREDLLRDATAFATRVQLQVSWGGLSSVVFAGFRAVGAVSFYFDQDPVYHFNTTGQLRRAFVDGYLIKAEAGRLVRLHRQHSASETAMIRYEMTVEEQETFCREVRHQLQELLRAMTEGKYEMEGQVAADENEDAVDLLRAYLEQLGEILVADSPRVAG